MMMAMALTVALQDRRVDAMVLRIVVVTWNLPAICRVLQRHVFIKIEQKIFQIGENPGGSMQSGCIN